MAVFQKQNLHIVICDVTNAPNDPETITKSLWTLLPFHYFLIGPNGTSSSPDMVNFDKIEILHILTLTSVTLIKVKGQVTLSRQCPQGICILL